MHISVAASIHRYSFYPVAFWVLYHIYFTYLYELQSIILIEPLTMYYITHGVELSLHLLENYWVHYTNIHPSLDRFIYDLVNKQECFIT